MRQANIFLEGEGDAWLERNRHALLCRHTRQQHDPVADMIEQMGIKPKRVLEVGCANGWRLAALRDKYGCEVFGVDPSRQACIEAAAFRVPATQSTATTLPETGAPFDLVIYGFCLYLTDPGDWLTIAGAGDQVLAAGGHMIIHDFADVSPPFARKYVHHDDILGYHFYFPELWLSHPVYQIVHCTVTDDQMVTLLRKHPVKDIEVRP